MKHSSFKNFFLLAFATSLAISACKKNEYFIDGGLSQQSEAEKNMTTYDFLASRPNHVFDSLVKIITLTNTKGLINQNNITLYAAPNEAIMRFQRRFTPSDKQAPRPLAKIGVDTLKMLLNRLIIPGYKITLEQAVGDKLRTYKDNNGDSINVYGKGGGVQPGSSVQTSAYYMEYEHRKIKKVDSVNYTGSIQTHNLITANARIHVLSPGSNFGLGLKQKYYRETDN
ncbi:hypothetical protein DBR11_28025 [Pedobacter sp. HMWF019]|uniref:hypothetical protein n=1 Tax=Pedobacter sp. HMWF019 TaxID=2056856 RepID=UPI000D37BFB2|nr:hypothetical protein [Pedobacter sp. HMWF019]PTS91967.1 hypothetical protein DBR11_28025 [Pedobacter sp. HMWF019]